MIERTENPRRNHGSQVAERMRCFIIMPYDRAFDACHASIRRAVESVTDPCALEPHRLDDAPEAGRIPSQLERALREADLCVADITPPDPAHPGFSNSNVMWEVGYAMALGKVPILIASNDVRLPFDVHDLHHVKYDRRDVPRTLEKPLARSVAATARAVREGRRLHGATVPEDMLHQIVQIMTSRRFRDAFADKLDGRAVAIHGDGSLDPRRLVGAWKNLETDSMAYVSMVGGRVFAPYCYGGNEETSGIYFDWTPVDGWFHARYAWVNAPIRGFSFLRPEGPSDMKGAWWYDGEAPDDPNRRPETHTGWQSHWTRMPDARTPDWAQEVFDAVRNRGLEAVLDSLGKSKEARRGRKWRP
jgi:Nucleoside 2-deoxyribosyltransferase